MKKIILTVLCVALAMVMLTACGRENVGDYTEKPSQSTTSTTTTTTKKTTENNTTGVLTPTTGGATSALGSTSQPNNG